jgi:hypothetical protein
LGELIGGENSMQRGIGDFNTLLDKHFKMAFHMEVVFEKLSRKVDKILEMVASGDAVENAGGSGSTSAAHKVDKLIQPALIQLQDALHELDLPNNRAAIKFHNAFIKKYYDLLLYCQKYNTSKVSNAPEHKVSHEFVKNQKTNIRNYRQNNDGSFAKEPRYLKFLYYLGVTSGK